MAYFLPNVGNNVCSMSPGIVTRLEKMLKECLAGGPCPFCGKTHETYIDGLPEDGTGFRVDFCNVCGVGFTMPKPPAAEIAGSYIMGSYRGKEGERFHPLVESFVRIFRERRRRRLGHFVSRGRILDIGCGRGLFLKAMMDAGWTVAGVELDPEIARETSTCRGFPVSSGDPSQWGFPEGSFDVITLSHVLEHTPDPAGMLSECRRLLHTGGILAIAVPNLGSLQAAFGLRHWFHLDIPLHLCHFTEKGLLSLLDRAGFKTVRVRHFDMEYNPFGWLQTLLNASGIRKNCLYDRVKRREFRERGGGWFGGVDLLLTLALLPLYAPLSLALALFESFALKRGGTIEVYASKA